MSAPEHPTAPDMTTPADSAAPLTPLAGWTDADRDRLAALLAANSAEDSSGCLLWTGGGQNEQGYPRVCVDGRRVRAHRLAYEVHVGPVLPGLLLDHACHTADRAAPAGRRAVTAGASGRSTWSL